MCNSQNLNRVSHRLAVLVSLVLDILENQFQNYQLSDHLVLTVTNRGRVENMIVVIMSRISWIS